MAADAVTGSVGDGVRRALTFWRRSLQARVVASTVILSALVVAAVGWFLLRTTRDGLVEHRVEIAMRETGNERREAVESLLRVPGNQSDVGIQLKDLTDPMIERGAARGFYVVLSGPVGTRRPLTAGGTRLSPNLDPASVPEDMLDTFAIPTDPQWTFTDVVVDTPQGATHTPGIVTGSQFQLPADNNNLYTLYFVFPMAEEQKTLATVTSAALTAGVFLLVLVAGVAWLVTRQVVTPIRLARQIAERLAAGELQERLRVTGEDDLAGLAASFNQMASNLQRQIRQLEELSRVQRRFVADVSHELRTPLTTVRMAAEVLHDARADFDPVTGRAAELLQKELDRFETLLGDLLEISRFDAGAAHLDTEDVDLVDVAHRIADSTQALAHQRGVAVVVAGPGHPCLAEADVRRVERIVRNLVTNAIDHAETRDVLVTVDGDDDAAAIAVRDYGVGLGVGEAAMVFNRFWRADPARARTSGGTGLGLSIALEDTHLHGGWLQAWGRPGEGAQFRLTLPRHTGERLRQSPIALVPTDAEERV